MSRQVELDREALAAAVASGRPCLDVPVGTGLLAAGAMDRGGPAPLVVAVDLNVSMLRRARRRLGDRAVYVRANVESLPLRTGVFGSVHSANGLHLFPSTATACREMARVAAPDGLVVATTWTAEGGVVARPYMRVLERLGTINPPEPADHYRAALAAAGLTERSADLSGSLLMWTGTKQG